MKTNLEKYGFKDKTFTLYSVKELMDQGIIEKPYDGNHGEIHPKGNDFVSSGVPFIMASDIKNGKVDYTNCKYITEQQANSLRHGFAKNGDVLLTHKATIGQLGIVDYHDHSFIMLTPQVTYYRVSDYKKLNNRYLRYYFESEFFSKTINLWADAGSTRAYLSIIKQQKLPIVFPDIKKQQKIAAILSAYDDLIENNNKRIALLEKAAEEIYREWFVRMRFPGWQQVKVVKGVPEGWEVIKVADAFEFLGGGTPSTTEKRYWDDGTVNWFTPSDITKANGIFLPESIDKCTEEGLNNSSARMFPAYSIMMTSRATIGAIGINTTPACTNQGFITCIPNENFPITFLYHWLKLNKHYFETVSTGSTFLELTKGTFKKIKILKPEKKLVEQYESKVQPMFKEMEFLLQKVDLLKKSRDLLLSRLISGKLSVEGLDIRFPESMM